MKFLHFDAFNSLKSWFIDSFVFVFLPYKYWEKKMKKKTVFYIDYEFFFKQIIAPLFLMKNIE